MVEVGEAVVLFAAVVLRPSEGVHIYFEDPILVEKAVKRLLLPMQILTAGETAMEGGVPPFIAILIVPLLPQPLTSVPVTV